MAGEQRRGARRRRCAAQRCGAVRERGSVVALVALWLPALLSLLLIAADGGRLLYTRQALQDAAESAALAAVRQLDPAQRRQGRLRIDPPAAAAAARAMALANVGPAASVSVSVRNATPAPAIGHASTGGRSVAGDATPPCVAVRLSSEVRLLWLAHPLTLSATATAALRPLRRTNNAGSAAPDGLT